MYSSELTVILLYTGIIPVGIAGTLIVKEGFSGFVSLRFLSILFIWLGYHFSLWVAYLSGFYWKSFLLVPNYVDSGLYFSILSMFCVLIGCGLLKIPPSYILRKKINRRIWLNLSNISNSFLLILLFANILLFILNVGGFDEIWNASYVRGEGQFDERQGLAKLIHMLHVLSTPMNVLVSSVATLAILKKGNGLLTKFLGCLLLFSASLESIHSFSRSAGFPLLIFAFLVLLIRQKNGIFHATIAVIVAFYLGSIGLQHRNNYTPGLYNFFKAVEHHEDISIKHKIFFQLEPGDNPLDAMAAWTRKTLSREMESSSSLSLVGQFILNLQPFPSEIVGFKPIGRDLSKIMGTWGSSGITTPAMAELYYVFGMLGSLFFIVIGRIFLFFDQRFSFQANIYTAVCLLLCFVSIPIGLHSGIRAMTRPLLYAVIIYYIFNTKFSQILSKKFR